MDWTEKKTNFMEIVEKQETVLGIQSEIINDLFQLLSEHLSANELDSLPAVGKINTAAHIREDITDLLYGKRVNA